MSDDLNKDTAWSKKILQNIKPPSQKKVKKKKKKMKTILYM